MEHQIEHEDNKKHVEEDDEQSIDRLRSSSSMSSTSDVESAITDFNLDEQDQIDRHDHGSFAIDDEQDEAHEAHLSDDLALQSPAIQTMERPSGSSGYRIPSHVFARKSSNPEWSTASNESLFSIHAGNTSFTRDQFNWLLKSGELGAYGGGEMPKTGDLPPLSPRYVSYPMEPKLVDTHKEEQIPPVLSHQQKEEQLVTTSQQHNQKEEQVPITSQQHNKEEKEEEQMPSSSPNTLKPGEEIIAAHFKTSINYSQQDKQSDLKKSSNKPPQVTASVDMGVGEAKKDEHMTSETKEKRSSASTSPSDDIPLTNCVSHHSDASGQSFAFPVLAEIGRDKSVNSAQSHVRADQQKKNTSQNDQEADKPPKTTTEEVHQKSSSWFSSCFYYFCCRCCRHCW